MRSIRSSGLGPIRAVGLATMMAATLTGTAIAQEGAPVTLRLGAADEPGRASMPYVEAFVEAAASISDGAVTIEPIYDAAGDDFEKGTAQLLVDGEVELALVAARSWEHVGISPFQALQAPFLIDSDALAVAVAESPIATQLLDGMRASGVTGLALWPEDLRHPVGFDHCTDPLVTPEAFEGLTIRAIPAEVGFALLESLGATPVLEEFDDACRIAGAESGLHQITSLPYQGTFVADVTFFPKFQVLAANSATFDRLTESQRAVIRDAAAAAQQRAITERWSDVESATVYCEHGGTVALAGPDGVAAFVAAAQPVYDVLAEDPATADAIDAIRALKETVVPGAAIEPCGSARAPLDAPVAAGVPTPIDGTYITHITYEELTGYCCLLDPGEINDENWGDVTMTFDSGAFSYELRNPRDEYLGSGTYAIDGDVLVIFDENGCCPVEPYGFGWDLKGDTLTLTRVEGQVAPSAFLIKPWTRLPG